tara:strand:+ start:1605 stop:1775 length:171 start_codon:yes stop_codon:yes gene_type:complete
MTCSDFVSSQAVMPRLVRGIHDFDGEPAAKSWIARLNRAMTMKYVLILPLARWTAV